MDISQQQESSKGDIENQLVRIQDENRNTSTQNTTKHMNTGMTIGNPIILHLNVCRLYKQSGVFDRQKVGGPRNAI